MKTLSKTHLMVAITIFTVCTFTTTAIRAETTNNATALIYDNKAYVHAIHSEPNPAVEREVENAEIVYVNTGYGPEIYSYPSNTSHQTLAFNVKYVDTAYGHSIYSYPRDTLKFHLELVNNTVDFENGFIVPTSMKMNIVPNSTMETAQ